MTRFVSVVDFEGTKCTLPIDSIKIVINQSYAGDESYGELDYFNGTQVRCLKLTKAEAERIQSLLELSDVAVRFGMKK